MTCTARLGREAAAGHRRIDRRQVGSTHQGPEMRAGRVLQRDVAVAGDADA